MDKITGGGVKCQPLSAMWVAGGTSKFLSFMTRFVN